MKKFLICLLIMFVFTAFIAPGAFADTSTEPEKVSFSPLVIEEKYYPDPPKTTAEHVIIIDNTTKTVLYCKGKLTEKLYPASTTKILTALVAAHYIDKPEETMITVSSRAANISENSSVMGLKSGDKVTALDLLYGMLLPSGNDAALALAEYISEHVLGGEKTFTELMNDFAADLGAVNTHFVNPHGLHNENHYSCAQDMAVFAHVLTRNELLSKIVKTLSYSATVERGNKTISLQLRNTNELLYSDNENYNEYVTGLKTGYTSSAGFCLAARYQKSGTDLLVLSFNSEQEARYSDTNDLISYASAGFTTINIADVFASRDFVIQVANSSISDENNGQLALHFTDVPDTVRVTSNTLGQAIRNTSFPVTVTMPQNVSAPIYIGDIVGTVTVYLNDEILVSGDVKATRTVLEEISLPADIEPLSIVSVDDGNSLFQSPGFWLCLFGGILLLAFAYILSRYIMYRVRMQKRRRRDTSYTRRSDGGFKVI